MRFIGKILIVSLMLGSPIAMGAVSDEDFEALRAELAALSEKFERMAEENAELKQANEETATAVAEVQETVAEEKSSWSDRVAIKGDFRYRYQNDAVGIPGAADRNRNRIRARAAIVADLPSNVEVGIGLATGGDDPVSSNLTLGNAGSSKDIKLDLAYFDWPTIVDAAQNHEPAGGVLQVGATTLGALNEVAKVYDVPLALHPTKKGRGPVVVKVSR